MKPTLRRTLETLRAREGTYVGGEQLTAYGGGHDATRRARELRADGSLPFALEVRRTPLGRWLYRIRRRELLEEQLELFREVDEQLSFWPDGSDE